MSRHIQSYIKGRDMETTESMLPGALLRYGINPEAWREYALFVSYDVSGNKKQETCFAFNEYPLQRFRKLKDEMRNPVFVLKHVDDIPSPVVRARMKGKSRQQPVSGNSCSSREAEARPLHTEDASSFGIAIFPYAAVQNDELDIDLDDTVLVISKPEPGWWLVQRHIPTGDHSSPIRGLVPSGCFLETSVPPLHFSNYRSDSTSTRSLTIPFSDVLSRSRRVVMLANYSARDEGELTVLKEELINEYKRYYNWSYVIKLENGERGWVPGWLVASKS
ncbi:hypothetical protein BDQ17DRAFT_1355697 [Cyathus striatus]|nr:hypothetical protein BDQ17DRAFT_1355697 [Cyathus striatus]